ncbi:unnamed protein product [Ilex paraguariensis]|uniref:Uncharacterized protein n=1 Tax=Ilex paraguariensis TaxID=185542 RepID=A0ABC8UXP8_9AQUA
MVNCIQIMMVLLSDGALPIIKNPLMTVAKLAWIMLNMPKRAEKPRLNFKNKYSDSYRNAHPNAPVIVPWVSGVVGA